MERRTGRRPPPLPTPWASRGGSLQGERLADMERTVQRARPELADHSDARG